MRFAHAFFGLSASALFVFFLYAEGHHLTRVLAVWQKVWQLCGKSPRKWQKCGNFRKKIREEVAMKTLFRSVI